MKHTANNQAVIRLRLDGYSLQEIVRKTGLPYPEVKQILETARQAGFEVDYTPTLPVQRKANPPPKYSHHNPLMTLCPI